MESTSGQSVVNKHVAGNVANLCDTYFTTSEGELVTEETHRFIQFADPIPPPPPPPCMDVDVQEETSEVTPPLPAVTPHQVAGQGVGKSREEKRSATHILTPPSSRKVAMPDAEGVNQMLGQLNKQMEDMRADHLQQMKDAKEEIAKRDRINDELRESIRNLSDQLSVFMEQLAARESEVMMVRAQLDQERAAKERAREAEQDLRKMAEKRSGQQVFKTTHGGRGKAPRGQAQFNVFPSGVDAPASSGRDPLLAANPFYMDSVDEEEEEATTTPSTVAAQQTTPGPSSSTAAKKKAAPSTAAPSVPVPVAVPVQKPRPIYVMKNGREVKQLLNQLDGVKGKSNFTMNGMEGVECCVQAATEEIRERIKEYLDKQRINHNVRPLKAETPVKVVLYGFARHTATEVLEIMQDCDELPVKPILAVQMMRHDSKTDKKVATNNFTVTFPAGVQLSSLQAVRGMDNTRCRFDALKKTKRLPYCLNCNCDGHVELGCFADPICAKCGRKHKTINCDKFKPGVQYPPAELWCFRESCRKFGHPAHWKGCPGRKSFFDKMAKQQQRTDANRQQRQQLASGGPASQRKKPLTPAERAHLLKYAAPQVQHQQPAAGGAWGQAMPSQQQPATDPNMLMLMQQIQQMNQAIHFLMTERRQSNGVN